MPRMATKAANNVFYKARLEAAKWNDRLSSREGAAEIAGIDRTRLANIELGNIYPHPEEVLLLCDTYSAPELANHYCSRCCPLGEMTVNEIELQQFETIVLQLIKELKNLPAIKDDLVDIAADGVIDSTEKPRMERILDALNEMSIQIESLKLYYRKLFEKEGVK
ncbi:MAG: transcriptional regulator [Clostridiales bacterium]|nr:MAG: transcriptional regulator [Clostridiales bacterium]